MTLEPTIEVVGVDGCPTGWVALTARDGRFAALEHFSEVALLVAAHTGAAVFGIDIPLSFACGRSQRATDLAARRLLGRQAASLFPVPPRDVLEAGTYAEANRRSRARYGRGISRQVYGLRGKILEAVGFLEATGDSQIYEIHPELSFRFMAEELGGDISASKKTATGFAERFALLDRVGLAPSLPAVPDLGRAAPDDVLDAAAAAWSAYRIATGSAAVILDVQEADDRAAPGSRRWAIRA